MKCPLCSSETSRLFQKNGHWIRECNACKHRLAEISPGVDHVNRVYGDQYFHGSKDGYPDYLKEAALLSLSGRRYGEILKNHLSLGTLLDVGCAAGFISKGLQDAGWKVSAIEPNQTMSEYASRLMGIQVETNSLENYRSEIQYDVITMVQVLPHFYDLNAALRVAANLTRPGGYWLIETYIRDSLTAKIFGQYWHEYRPPSVLHWFSKSGLGQITRKYGFSQVACGRPLKKINVGRVSIIIANELGKVTQKNLISSIFAHIPERLKIPYPFDDVFWALFKNK